MKNAAKRISIKQIITTAILSLIAIIQLYPLVWLILLSLKDNTEIFGENILGLPTRFLWQNYAKALSEAKVGYFFFNSVKVSVLAIFLSTLLAVMASYAIARMRWKMKNPVFNFFLLGMMIPAQAIIFPIYLIAVKTSLNNTHFLLILIYAVAALPTSIYIFTSFLKSLPRELEESAYIDGASVPRTFFSIIIPVIRSSIITVIILSFLGTWNEFLFSFILIDKETLRTIPVGLASMNGMYYTEWGPMAAGMVVATVPAIIIYILFSNQIQKSIIVGAVKG